MRFAPRLAVSLAMLSLLAAPVRTNIVWAADGTSATSAAVPADNSAAKPMPGAAALNSVMRPALLEGDNKVDVRLARLLHEVDINKVSGRLSNEQADNFLSALNQVAQREAEVIALCGKLPPATELGLTLELDRLEQIMYSSMHDRKVATLDLLGRETHMQHRIDEAESDGRLTKNDADDLRARLAAVLKDQSQRGGAKGKITYGDALIESLQLDRVQDQYVHRLQRRPYSVPDVQALIAEVETLEKKESKTGLDNIRLLSQQLNHPLPTSNSWRQMGAKAVGPENALQLAMQLEWVKALMQLNLDGKDVAVAPADTEKQLDQAIGKALDLGHLTPVEAQQLQSDLEAIMQQHQSYTLGGNQLGSEQNGQLALALARLSGRLDRAQHVPTRLWGGIDAFQVSIDDRLAEGLKAGRLTKDQATDLKKTADAISSTEEGLRKSGGLDGKNALSIATQLAQLNVKLHQTLSDRGVKAPDIDQLAANLSKTLTDSVEMGKIGHEDHLVNVVNHATELRKAYEQAPGGLDTRAKLAIGQSIEHSVAQLKAAVHHDETVARPTLDMRISQLNEDIAQAGVTGVMSVQRAAQYKAAVDTIYGELLNARKASGGMQPTQVVAIANDITSLRDQFDDEMRDDATLPLHLAPRLRELAARVGRALADGRLPLSEAVELITQLDHTAERLAAAASTQGGLSHGEGLRLAYEIEAITDRLESGLQDQPLVAVAPQQKAAEVDSKVANALAAGKISVEQAQDYRHQFDKVVQDDISFERTDNSLSYTEALALDNEWDELGKMVDKTAPAPGQFNDITSRRLQMEKRVNDAVASGKLNKDDGQKLLGELDRLAQTEANFRVSDERLDLQEAMTLALDLDRLSSKVDSTLKGQLSLKQKH